ncbi:hypothetical protein O987_23290 [Comamonas testosteroni TK102]|uniref:Uncharacterized protein n=1 Tax=Comamonas testosteroni TK102 TaxID=1392005 RepID=A0A076PVJ7_COMTE|nr:MULTISPECIES: hypothetical protein [Comamonas]AIJ48741.1 hypothetical protein O987_23290 [Comamonas testosteroni TK102]MPS90774.1 hypothetical protein [Comamonas sp.]
MSTTLEQLFSQFTNAAQAARDQQDKWLIIDPVYEHLETLQEAALEQVLPHILTLIETYPELDYGGPGPFGSLIEEHPMATYTPALLASLERQPSVQVMGWLDRTMRVDEDFQRNDPNPVGAAEFAAVLRKIVDSPLASDDCKEFAQICLKDLK